MSGCGSSFVCSALRSFWWSMTLLLVFGYKLLVKRGRVSISRCNAIFIRSACCFLRWPRRIEPGSMTITVHSLNQACQHAANFVQASVERFVLLLCEQTKIARQQKKILEFTGRPGRNIKKLTKFGLAATSAALRDVSWDGSCCSPHLASDAISFRVRESASRHVDAQDKRMAPLPHPELLKILHSSSEKFPFSRPYLRVMADNCLAPSHRSSQTLNSCVYLQLITNDCQLPTGSLC